MALPWTTVDSAATRDGELALQRRGTRDCLITIDGRVLMNSLDHRSEVALGALAAARIAGAARPRVLVGGLGMGFTLRALLDALPGSATVQVAELNPVIVAWCRGPIADLTGAAVADPRVTVTLGDFADALRAAAKRPPLDAIVIDLYVGPDGDPRPRDPLYGAEACERAFAALRPGGVFAVWGESFSEGYARLLRGAGFTVEREHPARGSRRFVVYLATRPPEGRPAAKRRAR
jgi:spermidine synthase